MARTEVTREIKIIRKIIADQKRTSYFGRCKIEEIVEIDQQR